MPALVLFGQPTIVSGDDIRWICILLILLRLMQFACVVPFLVYVVDFHDGATPNEEFEKCIHDTTSLVSKAKEIAISYGVLTLVLVVSSIVLESFIWRTSLLGTPTEPEKRAALHYLCGIKLVPGSMLRVGTMGLGITMTIILKDFCDCHFGTTVDALPDDHSPDLLLRDLRCGSKFQQVRLLLVILVISHMTEVCFATLMYGCILFQSLRGKQHLFRLARWIQTLGGLRRGRSSNDSSPTGGRPDGSGWQCFCSCCFTLTSLLTCCMLGGTKAATADFRDISMALVMFLDDGGYLDITISDVLAALVVLHKQHQEERYARIHQIQSQISLHVGDASNSSTHRTTTNSIQQQRQGDNPTVNNPPSGTQNLGTGSIDENEQVDVEAVFRSASHEDYPHQSLQQQLLKDGHDHDNEESDIERQESRRNPTMFRWTLQREADHSNSSSRDDFHHHHPQHRGLHHTALPHTASAHYERNERAVLMPTDPSAKHAMATGAHFMRLALAVYGPFFNVAAKPCQCSLCCLGVDAFLFPFRRRCGNGNCSSSSTNNHVSLRGDNLCECNSNALLREANLSMEDVAYADFHSDVDKNPYAIIIDRPWKSIVVAIRGSLTLESIVTDLALIPARLDTVIDDLLAGEEVVVEEEEDDDDDDAEKTDSAEFVPAAEAAVDADDDISSHVYCHSGMLKTAQWIYSDLHRHGILDRLLLDDNAPYADYQLVLTGHSLGAGLSAILGIMLRPKFSTLKCVCFSPPGGTLSENALAASKAVTTNAVMDEATSRAHGDGNDGTNVDHNNGDFITSYLVGSDIIPRMSVEAMEALRDDVLEMVARIKVNKVQVMRGGDEVSQLIHGKDSIPRTQFQQQLLGFWAHQASLRDTRPTGNNVKLYPPPGRIVHFVKTTTKSSRPSAHGIRAAAQAAMTTSTTTTTTRLSTSYTAIWAERQDLAEIQLSASMMADHFPWTALDIMEQIASDDFGLSEPYFLPI